MKRALLLAVVGASLFLPNHGGVALQAQAPDALNFFKNYFVTGDYVVGGTGLTNTGVGGVSVGSIGIAGVPTGADIQAVYLYWQIVSTDTLGPDSGSVGATFRGNPLVTPEGPAAKVLGAAGSSPCWSSGGGTGTGGSKRTYTYRADVLRHFDVDAEGKVQVNGSHAIQVPDSGGNGNSLPIAIGASLVVVYRSLDPAAKLSAIVIYDGSYSVNNSTQTLSQTIKGFYQPASTNPDARITFIAGSGQANKFENLYFDGGLLSSNAFSSSAGNNWDNPTFSVDPGTDGEVTASLDASVGSSDCLNWGAIIFKTAVQDTDNDGLLDVWEDATSSSPVLDPSGQALPPLGSMDADKNVKDIFVEVGYFKTDAATSYGGTLKPAHSHMPTHESLKLVGDSFAKEGIKVHFDVGDDYPFGSSTDASKNAEEYLIPRGTGFARGGEAIDEMVSTLCTSTGAPWDCQFSDYPGTVGWKTGFRYLRDEVLSGPEPVPGEDDLCDAPGATCTRRFDRNRKDIFHYAMFAHALGLPRSEAPCLNGSGQPTGADGDVCASGHTVNPDFRIPRTTTGVGDFPGGDLIVTLGGFPDTFGLPIGTPFMVASTMMHELGHNFERRHSGEPSSAATPNPNCKPTYLSVMNYLYQLRGLLDDSGKPHLDFSGTVGPTLDESNLTDGISQAPWQITGPYRIGWYAPLIGSYLEGQATGAKKHCDGSDLNRDEFGQLTEPEMVRIDAQMANTLIDWNANGVTEIGTLDVNFNGRTTALPTGGGPELNNGSNDWANIRLNQVGSRRSIGGLYIDELGNLRLGALSLDSGRGDYGRGDYGRGDYGRGDYGRGDYGRGDLGRGDYGRGDYGRGDYGRGDYGRGDYGRGDYGGGDLFVGNPINYGGELDAETAGDLAKTPPNEFRACIIGVGGCTAATGSLHDVRTDFKAPNVGGVSEFIVFRVAGDRLTRGATWVEVGRTPSVPGQIDYTIVGNALPELKNGFAYTYFAVAVYADGIRSDASNLVTIDPAINDTPTISNIPDQSIVIGGIIGPVAFTIGDERLFNVTLSGTSSNQALVPDANIVFGGSGANRTVTITPVAGQTGTATITVTVTDGADNLASASDTFGLTVTPVPYVFTGFLSPMVTTGTEAAPSNAGSFSHGKAIPLKWTLTLGGVTVTDLSSLQGLIAVPGTYSAGGGGSCAVASGTPAGTLFLLTPTGQPTGNSTYRIGSGQFIFNWDTSAAVQTSCYVIKLTLNDGTAPRATFVRFR